MTSLPSLFVSHGAPLFAVDAGTTGPALQAWGATLPADLRGIVIMSPHWMVRSPAVMASRTSRTFRVGPLGAPRRDGSAENDICVLAMQTGK